MKYRHFKWILSATFLAVLLLVYGLADTLIYGVGSWDVPWPQPEQFWSRIHCDPKLTDPFFKSNKWSYPSWIIPLPDGSFEDTTSAVKPKEEPPRLKHTAECFSRYSGGHRRLVRFCEANLVGPEMVDLLIHVRTPSYADTLRIWIRNGKFKCQYWSQHYGAYEPANILTTRQKLTLDKKVYRKGDVIKGRIDYEGAWEINDRNHAKKIGTNAITVRVLGVFKTAVE